MEEDDEHFLSWRKMISQEQSICVCTSNRILRTTTNNSTVEEDDGDLFVMEEDDVRRRTTFVCLRSGSEKKE